MTAFLALLRKDLLLYFSNRRSVIMSIVAPILIAAFFGSLFGGGDTKPANIPVAIIDHGKVVASGTLAELLRALPAAQTLALDIEGTPDIAALQRIDGVKQVQLDGGKLTLGLDDLTSYASAVLQAVRASGVVVRHLSSGRANLEDVFLALTGRQLRD